MKNALTNITPGLAEAVVVEAVGVEADVHWGSCLDWGFWDLGDLEDRPGEDRGPLNPRHPGSDGFPEVFAGMKENLWFVKRRKA